MKRRRTAGYVLRMKLLQEGDEKVPRSEVLVAHEKTSKSKRSGSGSSGRKKRLGAEEDEGKDDDKAKSGECW